MIANFSDERIVWYENTDGQGTFAAPRDVDSDAENVSLLVAADVDADGDVDLLAGFGNRDLIAWYENTDGRGTFSSQRVVSSRADWVSSLEAADIDGDGTLDVVASIGRPGERIVWYQHTDGQGTFSAERLIHSGTNRSIEVADADGDGDVDIYSMATTTTHLLENLGGSSFAKHEFRVSFSARSLQAIDVDADNDLDLIGVGAFSKIYWHENIDGKGTLDEEVLIVESGSLAFAADVDGDAYVDLLVGGGAPDKLAWYKNPTDKGPFEEQPPFTHATVAPEVVDVSSVDLDGDGHLDVLYVAQDSHEIAWHSNADGKGTFGEQRIIAHSLSRPMSVFAADLDADGDLDVLSASRTSDMIAWHENLDGRGAFGLPQLITMNARGAARVAAADVNGDGDLDVIALSQDDETIAFYENTDGRGTFGVEQVIADEVRFGLDLAAADIDQDGDVDIVYSSDRAFAWVENEDGKGSFGEARTINDARFLNYRSIQTSDLDGDGDLDLLGNGRRSLDWYENVGGDEVFSEAKTIGTSRRFGESLATDFDGDGDLDVLATDVDGRRILFYENTDGLGAFSGEQTLQIGVSAWYTDVADLDGDADLDIVTAGRDTVTWREARLLGDVNSDDVFNSSDLVSVFQAGKFETGSAAIWEEGDWNGDGLFDSGDLVAAFRGGHYVGEAARPARAELIAKIDWIFSDDDKD